MQSMLVMERRPKDYMPFEYDKLPQYNGEDLTSLEGIDEFTCKFTSEEDLKAELVMANFIDDFEFSNKMKIVYYENEKLRENKYGVCYKNIKPCLNPEFIVNFLFQIIDKPQLTNRIYNEFGQKRQAEELSEQFKKVLQVLKNVRHADNIKDIYFVGCMPYNELRALGLFIIHTFSDIIVHEESNNYGDVHERKRVPASQS